MPKRRSHSSAFRLQVAQGSIAGETLQGLSQGHDISRQLIRTWSAKSQASAAGHCRPARAVPWPVPRSSAGNLPSC